MLLLVILANFTGYLLSWNQIFYWAIKAGSNLARYFPVVGLELKRFILAGEEVGNDTLSRAFAFRAGVIPLLLLILTALHLWRLCKDGALAVPPEAAEDQLPAKPWLSRAEGAVALLTLSALLLFSLYVHAPISERANPQHPPNPAKAPWYFVGFQEMVS